MLELPHGTYDFSVQLTISSLCQLTTLLCTFAVIHTSPCFCFCLHIEINANEVSGSPDHSHAVHLGVGVTAEQRSQILCARIFKKASTNIGTVLTYSLIKIDHNPQKHFHAYNITRIYVLFHTT